MTAKPFGGRRANGQIRRHFVSAVWILSLRECIKLPFGGRRANGQIRRHFVSAVWILSLRECIKLQQANQKAKNHRTLNKCSCIEQLIKSLATVKTARCSPQK